MRINLLSAVLLVHSTSFQCFLSIMMDHTWHASSKTFRSSPLSLHFHSTSTPPHPFHSHSTFTPQLYKTRVESEWSASVEWGEVEVERKWSDSHFCICCTVSLSSSRTSACNVRYSYGPIAGLTSSVNISQLTSAPVLCSSL